MTKELAVQRELNYAFCHTVTVNLMHTESRINNLSKAADALLSTLLRSNYLELLDTQELQQIPPRRLQTCHSKKYILKIAPNISRIIAVIG